MATLNQLRYFVAVADALHFGRAAVSLGISQPALSQQIRQLEGSLGFEVVRRDRRRVSLTDGGAALLQHARRTLLEVDRGLAESRRIARGEREKVRIGFIGPAALGYLPGLLAQVFALSPPVEVSLHEHDTPVALARLKAGALDLALLRGPIVDAGIRTVTVQRDGLLVALPAAHPLARRRRVDMAALASEPLVLFQRSRAPAMYDAVMDTYADHGLEPSVAWELHDWPVILSFVASGFGISIVPASIAVFQRAGCVYRPLADVTRQVDLTAGWSDGQPAAALRRVLALVTRGARAARTE